MSTESLHQQSVVFFAPRPSAYRSGFIPTRRPWILGVANVGQWKRLPVRDLRSEHAYSVSRRRFAVSRTKNPTLARGGSSQIHYTPARPGPMMPHVPQAYETGSSSSTQMFADEPAVCASRLIPPSTQEATLVALTSSTSQYECLLTRI